VKIIWFEEAWESYVSNEMMRMRAEVISLIFVRDKRPAA